MQHPIIALWADPSLDSHVLREEFKDGYTWFVEPFSPLTYLFESKAYYDLKKGEILEASKLGPVFLFDATDKPSDDLLLDEEFLQRITHTFLVKDADSDGICRKVTSCADLAPIIVIPDSLEESPAKAAEAYAQALGQKLVVKAITTVPGHFLDKAPIPMAALRKLSTDVNVKSPAARKGTAPSEL